MTVETSAKRIHARHGSSHGRGADATGRGPLRRNRSPRNPARLTPRVGCSVATFTLAIPLRLVPMRSETRRWRERLMAQQRARQLLLSRAWESAGHVARDTCAVVQNERGRVCARARRADATKLRAPDPAPQG